MRFAYPAYNALRDTTLDVRQIRTYKGIKP